MLSFPYERVIFTRQARPNLAPQAPRVRIIKTIVGLLSEKPERGGINIVTNPKIITSKLSRHINKW